MKAIRQIFYRNIPTGLNRVASLLLRLKVLILYDVDSSGASAMALYQRLLNRLDDGYFFDLKLWRFDLLDLPESSCLASRDLAEADMVIVAWSRAITGLSWHAAWVQRWPTCADKKRALVSLFIGSRVETNKRSFARECAFLRALAERTGMDLISSPPPKAVATSP